VNFIRPIEPGDLDALVDMARTAGAGFTSLPPVPEFLAKKIDLSRESFAGAGVPPGHERYMFVLEDSTTGKIGGCCAVEAACGLDEPFYNYHVGVTVHATQAPKVYNRTASLYLSNDLTGAAVLCSLYLRPDFRGGGAGHLLSKSRFLFMASYPQRFGDKVIAEMRGVSNEQGRSPFWEGLGRHFFSIEYSEAEHIVGTGNKAFIAELMPKHPIYAVLLPAEAQAVMGKVHPQTAPALKLLEQEGFRYQGYIDIFDGGPTVEAPRDSIRTVRRTYPLRWSVATDPEGGSNCLVSNGGLGDYRCALARLNPGPEQVEISAELAEVLKLRRGQPLWLSNLG
jgi:arginine N-succinyltransferase